MNGAESLIHTVRSAGVDLCLANPGTTEMPLVAALDAVPGVRAVLGLFEGVCTGAADGFGRMRDRPALTLLHLGPGFANGIANLHNARRARSPVLNVVGDHATWHLPHDAPLSSDIASLARPVSAWVRTARSAADLAGDAAAALEATAAGGVATLIVPHDCQWEDAAAPAPARDPLPPARVEVGRIDEVAGRLRDATGAIPSILLLGGAALRKRGLRAAARVAAAAGARLVCETFPARLERGGGLPELDRLPYFPEQAVEFLTGCPTLVLAGARDPVAFFGYPGGQSRLAPEAARVESLAAAGDDVASALEDLADALDAPAAVPAAADKTLPALPKGALDPTSLGAALAALQPENAIVMDEGATSGLPWFVAARDARAHTVLTLTGGAIGQGLPCAAGAALACPERKVIALQADGSGLYTVQALWTLAREQLDVLVLVCANRSYRILQIELARAGISEPGPQALGLTDLGRPPIDWVALARGFGVPGARVETVDDLLPELRRAFAEPGPRLIEAVL